MAGERAGMEFGLSEGKRTEALACIERSRRCQSGGDVEGAEIETQSSFRALEEALVICPSNHRARSLLVSCAMNADDYPRAKAEAVRIYSDLSNDQLMQLNDSALHLSITHTSKMLGELEDAIKFATEATELFPGDPQPHMVLGELRMSVEDHTEAERCFRKTLLCCDSPSCKNPLNDQNVYFTLCCLGAALANQAKNAEAETFLLRASRQDPSSTLALSTLVDVYHSQGRVAEAMDLAKRIFELDPNDAEIQMKIDDILDGQSRSETEVSSPRQHLQRSREQSRGRRDLPGASDIESLSRGRLEPPGASDTESLRSYRGNAGRDSAESVTGSDRSRHRGVGRRYRRDVPPDSETSAVMPSAKPKPKDSGRKDDSCLSFFCLERFDDKQPV